MKAWMTVSAAESERDGDVPEVKEGCFTDELHMLFEREGLVQNDAKITDVKGGGYCGAVNIWGEVVSRFGECFGANYNYY